MEFKKLGIPREVILDVLEEYYKNRLESSKDDYMYYKRNGDWDGIDISGNNIDLYQEYLQQIKEERRLIWGIKMRLR